jgi:hypothetical protein
MTIDDPTLAERRFTETHDRILQALVERVHDMSLRLAALEAASEPAEQLAPPAVPAPTTTPQTAAVTTPKTTPSPADRPSWQSTTARPTGWQPARR